MLYYKALFKRKFLKKTISLIEGKKRLRNLSKITSETSIGDEIGIYYDSPVCIMESQDIERRAILIAAVFYERMSPAFIKKHYEYYHRNILPQLYNGI